MLKAGIKRCFLVVWICCCNPRMRNFLVQPYIVGNEKIFFVPFSFRRTNKRRKFTINPQIINVLFIYAVLRSATE